MRLLAFSPLFYHFIFISVDQLWIWTCMTWSVVIDDVSWSPPRLIWYPIRSICHWSSFQIASSFEFIINHLRNSQIVDLFGIEGENPKKCWKEMRRLACFYRSQLKDPRCKISNLIRRVSVRPSILNWIILIYPR